MHEDAPLPIALPASPRLASERLEAAE
jgi:hypothetical protein